MFNDLRAAIAIAGVIDEACKVAVHGRVDCVAIAQVEHIRAEILKDRLAIYKSFIFVKPLQCIVPRVNRSTKSVLLGLHIRPLADRTVSPHRRIRRCRGFEICAA